MPADLWQKRVSHKYKASAPRVVETPGGSRWTWDGQLWDECAAGSSNAKLRQAMFGKHGVETAEGSLPPSDPKLLLEHLDLAGIYAGVFYGDTRKWLVKDEGLRKEMYRAFNDYMLEISSYAPDRLLALPELPTMHPDFCLAEMKRVVAAGAKSVEFSPFDANPPVWDRAWEPSGQPPRSSASPSGSTSAPLPARLTRPTSSAARGRCSRWCPCPPRTASPR